MARIKLDYSNRDFNSIRSELLREIPNYTNKWTDFNSDDLGIVLLELFAYMGDMLSWYIDFAANEGFFRTARRRDSVVELAKLIDYTPRERTAAYVILKMGRSGTGNLIVPRGFQVGTVPLTTEERKIFSVNFFESLVENTGLNISDDGNRNWLVPDTATTFYLSAFHGEFVSGENVGTSNGVANQVFELSRNEIIPSSVVVYVNGTKWTEVGDFIDSGAMDEHYVISVNSRERVFILFSDGIRGKIPPVSSVITADYQVGGGEDGNVGSGRIISFVDLLTNLDSVINERAASGGSLRESVEVIRENAIRNLRSLDRAVTPSDFSYLVEHWEGTTGRIAQAKAYEQAQTVWVVVVPEGGGLPSTSLKLELEAYLDTKRLACFSVKIKDPTYVPIDVVCTVYIEEGYIEEDVSREVNQVIESYLSPTFIDDKGRHTNEFGRDVYLSQLYALIEGVSGVDHVIIDTPRTDVVIDDFEISEVGSIQINIGPPVSMGDRLR